MTLDVLRAGDDQQNVLLHAVAREGFPAPAGFFGRKRRDGFHFQTQRGEQVFQARHGSAFKKKPWALHALVLRP